LTDEGNLEWYGALGKLQWESKSARHWFIWVNKEY
jgi:hypothetical protein